MDRDEGDGIAVVIVNYATSQLVLAGLPALEAELEPFAHAHVFIVDNASPGGDGDALASGLEASGPHPRVTLLRSEVNGGFAAGNNVAFAEIRRRGLRPEAILLLNPDAEPEPGALAQMLAVMRARPRAGFVGPRLVYPDGTSWAAAFHFPSMAGEVTKALGIGVLARMAPILIPETDVPTRADWITGSAALVRREAFEALGDMDDGYFLYYEEVDYMLQGARLGWESWHAPAARVRHVGGASTGVRKSTVREKRMPAYWFRSWARYFAKNHGPGYARLTALLTIAARWLGDVQRRLRGQRDDRPDRFLPDFAANVAFARLSPPPASPSPSPLAAATGAGASQRLSSASGDGF